MIWTYIRDFLVQYIFGGFDSLGNQYGGIIGRLVVYEDGVYTDDMLCCTYEAVFDSPVKYVDSDSALSYGLSLGDWLSTTATIIIMCIAVFLMIMLVRWVWRLVTSAFLLK